MNTHSTKTVIQNNSQGGTLSTTEVRLTKMDNDSWAIRVRTWEGPKGTDESMGIEVKNLSLCGLRCSIRFIGEMIDSDLPSQIEEMIW